jgi:hypothetical protein
VRRAKKGKPSVQPIRGDELRMLTALRKEYPDSGYVFTTERGTPFTPDAINRHLKAIGKRAGLAMPVHFHMLRHSCGYKLANDGVDTRANPRLAGTRLDHSCLACLGSRALSRPAWPPEARQALIGRTAQAHLAGVTRAARRSTPASAKVNAIEHRSLIVYVHGLI